MKKNKGFFGTIGGWLKRLFHGGSKVLADEMEENAKNMKVEEIVSPFKQIVRGFFERRLAVIALCVVIAMFLLVFIATIDIGMLQDGLNTRTWFFVQLLQTEISQHTVFACDRHDVGSNAHSQQIKKLINLFYSTQPFHGECGH